MDAKIGAKLAQLANARKQAVAHQLSPEEIVAAQAAHNLAAFHLMLLPHVEEFNSCAEPGLHLTLDLQTASIAIQQNGLTLLVCEVTHKAVVLKRISGVCTSDDYFTLGTEPDGTLTFRNYSAEVRRPLDGGQFAEIVLMEALGLNEEPPA